MSYDSLKAVQAYNEAYNVAKNKFHNTDTDNSSGGDEMVSVSGATFDKLVNNALSKTVNSIQNAEQIAERSLTEDISLTEVVQSINEADITIQAITAIKDKVIAAYQDIIKMPI